MSKLSQTEIRQRKAAVAKIPGMSDRVLCGQLALPMKEGGEWYREALEAEHAKRAHLQEAPVDVLPAGAGDETPNGGEVPPVNS